MLKSFNILENDKSPMEQESFQTEREDSDKGDTEAHPVDLVATTSPQPSTITHTWEATWELYNNVSIAVERKMRASARI